MTSSTLSSRVLFVAAVVALPFAGGGCGREACFTWSTIEGACPAQAEALSFFTNPACPGQITSVQSEGTTELDGTLCCYQVTAREESDETLCQGFGGANSTGSVGKGVGGSSSFVASTSVGQGGGVACAHCADNLTSPSLNSLCEGSGALLKELFGCACSAACTAECGDNFCVDGTTTGDCFACLGAMMTCSTQFNACANDI